MLGGADGEAAVAERLAADSSGALRRLFARFQANNRALMAYRPQPCDVAALLLACGDADPGWTALAQGGVDIRAVPGDHSSVLAPPNLDVCAAILDQALACARKPR